jgi:cell wall-associated NlpC family hydrolase
VDRRLTPANGRVASYALAGLVEAERFVPGEEARVIVPVIDLLDAPNGKRDRQLLFGEAVTIFERLSGHAFVQAGRDGYVGYVAEDSLGEALTPTHRVATRATHAYMSEDMKSANLMRLPLGARIRVLDERKAFYETSAGFIPKKHLRPLDQPFADPVTVAQLFFGTPYLWGGNSDLGIDCSGLVQAACLACDIACPGDSDLQCAELGNLLEDGLPPQRGHLWFWKGHVGWVVDGETLLHANAHHMAVTYEPLEAARLRIEAQGGGAVIARKRLAAPPTTR